MPGIGLVCADGCSTRRFLGWLEEPFMPWEIDAETRIADRRMQLLKGDIPA